MDVISLVGGRIAGINRACEGQIYSGDAIFSFELDNGYVVGIADGLGHGIHAHKISNKIKNYIESNQKSDITALLYGADNYISPCDGAAVGLAYLNFHSNSCSFAAIGNINGYIIGNRDKVFTSRDGMVGARMRTPLLQTESITAGDKIILTSDGIKERFYGQCNRQAFRASPVSVVESLIDQYSKRYDDASCWVVGV